LARGEPWLEQFWGSPRTKASTGKERGEEKTVNKDLPAKTGCEEKQSKAVPEEEPRTMGAKMKVFLTSIQQNIQILTQGSEGGKHFLVPKA
jgi:hypothetical protein